jgi:hypothetical protein
MVGTNLRLLEQRFQRLEVREKRMQRSSSVITRHHHLAAKRDPRLDEELVYEPRDYVTHSPRNAAPLRTEETKVKSAVQREVAGSTTAVKKHVEQFLANVELSRQMLRSVAGAEHGCGEDRPPVDSNDETFLTGVGSMKNAARLRDDVHFAELFGAATDEPQMEEQVISRVTAGGYSRDVSPSSQMADTIQPSSSPLRPSTTAAAGRRAVSSATTRTSTSGSSYANANPVQLKVTERPSTAQSHGASSNVSKMVAAFFRSMPPLVPPRPASSLPKRVFPAANLPALDDVHPSPSEAIAAAARTKEFYNLQIRIVHADPDLRKWEFTVVISDVTNISVATPQHRFHRLRVTAHNYLIFHPPANIVLSPCDDIPWVAGAGALYNHTLRLEVFATLPQHTKVVDTLVFYGKTPIGSSGPQ